MVNAYKWKITSVFKQPTSLTRSLSRTDTLLDVLLLVAALVSPESFFSFLVNVIMFFLKMQFCYISFTW